jgi:hypothetical protein
MATSQKKHELTERISHHEVRWYADLNADALDTMLGVALHYISHRRLWATA